VNLIVGTTNNMASIAMSVNKAAKNLIKKGSVVTEPILNMIEMAFRAYDPCFGCATHSMIGKMPLQVTLHDADGVVLDVITRD
jgi:F420-non-reducing hydrogenase large subunit